VTFPPRMPVLVYDVTDTDCWEKNLLLSNGSTDSRIFATLKPRQTGGEIRRKTAMCILLLLLFIIPLIPVHSSSVFLPCVSSLSS